MRFTLRILPALLVLAAAARAAHAAEPPVPPPPRLEATAWVLVDQASGQVLAGHRQDEPIEPASITKLMSAYAVFHALKDGKLKLDTLVPVSEHAWRSEGSRTYLDLGSRVPVEVLVQGMIVQSGNDATIALAEAIAGTEDTFAALMNQYAERLGLTEPTGARVFLGGRWYGVIGVMDPLDLAPDLDRSALIGFPLANDLYELDDIPSQVYVRMDPDQVDAVREVMPPSKLRWIAFSHVEADECGALNEWLAEAPSANPLCGQIAAMVSVGDLADREPRGLADGERIAIGRSTLTWLDAPNLPHGWECGYLFEARTRTLLCGDLLTQPGSQVPAVTESDAAIWEPSDGMRKAMSYFADLRNPASIIEKLAATEPEVLACMHGSSYRGKGAPLLRRLGEALSGN